MNKTPMATTVANKDPLTPAQSEADWEAQGWARESVPATASPRLQSTISVRFDPDGARDLRRAARLKGMTQSEFVRQATLEEASRTMAQAQIPVTSVARSQRAPSAKIEGRVIIGLGSDISKVYSALEHLDTRSKRIGPRHASTGEIVIAT